MFTMEQIKWWFPLKLTRWLRIYYYFVDKEGIFDKKGDNVQMAVKPHIF